MRNWAMTASTVLQFGELNIPNVKTHVLSRPLFAGGSGLSGLDLLKQYRLTFEVDKQRMFLEAGSN